MNPLHPPPFPFSRCKSDSAHFFGEEFSGRVIEIKFLWDILKVIEDFKGHICGFMYIFHNYIQIKTASLYFELILGHRIFCNSEFIGSPFSLSPCICTILCTVCCCMVLLTTTLYSIFIVWSCSLLLPQGEE